MRQRPGQESPPAINASRHSAPAADAPPEAALVTSGRAVASAARDRAAEVRQRSLQLCRCSARLDRPCRTCDLQLLVPYLALAQKTLRSPPARSGSTIIRLPGQSTSAPGAPAAATAEAVRRRPSFSWPSPSLQRSPGLWPAQLTPQPASPPTPWRSPASCWRPRAGWLSSPERPTARPGCTAGTPGTVRPYRDMPRSCCGRLRPSRCQSELRSRPPGRASPTARALAAEHGYGMIRLAEEDRED